MHSRVTLNFKTNVLFLFSKFSCSKLSSDKQFFFPIVTSPLADKTCSTGAVEAGVHRILEATGNNKRYISLFYIQ